MAGKVPLHQEVGEVRYQLLFDYLEVVERHARREEIQERLVKKWIYEGPAVLDDAFGE